MTHTARMRQEANRAILELLAAQVEAHPDLRFGQLLMVTQVITSYTTGPQLDSTTHIQDPFNEESAVTLARMEKVTL